MKLVFLSNYFNHHQKALCDALNNQLDGQFYFISTTKMSDERKKLGYSMEDIPVYAVDYYSAQQNCQRLIDDADVVLFGTAPEGMLKNRIKAKKLIVRYSERIYKTECPVWKLPIRAIKYAFKYGKHRKIYMLCASAYTAKDYSRTKTYIGRTYKWGYFPSVKKYESIDSLISDKNQNSILWCGRFIDWKNPQLPILVAKQLKEEGYSFNLSLIGTGDMEQSMNEMIEKYGLQDSVKILGSMKPEQVRKHMESSQLFLFTSDKNEGWGAVLNEAMNSGCAVVASHAIGAVPYLIENEENGLIYQDGNFNSLYNCVKHLLCNKNLCDNLGKKAYRTITEIWNSDVASERLLVLIDELNKRGTSDRFKDGPCSKASIINDDWFKG